MSREGCTVSSEGLVRSLPQERRQKGSESIISDTYDIVLSLVTSLSKRRLLMRKVR